MDEYIERKAVFEDICVEEERAHRFRCPMGADAASFRAGMLTAFGLARCIIDRKKAAHVAPVRHGRWDGGTCTHCKLPWNYNMVQDADDWGYMDPMPDFCPNCGAKMAGEETEK